MQRGDVDVILAYYPAPLVGSERLATVTLRTREGRKLQEIVATLRGHEPLTVQPLQNGGPVRYPLYEVLTASGTTDVVEHRRQEPVFYITDNPEVRRKLAAAP
jgi:hypothetical protein